MKRNKPQKEAAKYILSLVISTFVILSVFSTGLASPRRDEKRIEMIVQKRGSNLEDSISSHGKVIEEYDNFFLLETSEDEKSALRRDGYTIESLENKYHVGLGQYTFNTRDGPPETPGNLKIDEYGEDVSGLYIVQFIGPIKSGWKERMRSMGVSFHEFRHRFNYIVSMDPGIRRDVERLDFVNWVGIYQPAYRFDSELLKSEGSVSLEVTFARDASTGGSLPVKRISTMGENAVRVQSGKMKMESSPKDIERIARLNSVLSIRESNEDYSFLNSDATWIGQTNEEGYRKVTEKSIVGSGELITVMDSQLYMEDDYNGDGVHEMWEDPEGNAIGDDHRKVQAWYVPGDSNAKLDYGVYHGTHVTGTVLGDSPDYEEYSGKDGHAIGARLVFQDIDNEAYGLNLPSDMYNMGWGDTYDRGSRIHTNSWGGGDGYGGYALEGDQFLWDHKDFNILYAMGNSGPENDTLSQQAEGKNIISVGSVIDSPYQNQVSDFSSRGYADDGRIKPTVMHVGDNVVSANRSYDGYQSLSGTSMATPGVAGQLGQIRQYYEEGWHVSGEARVEEGFEPSNALVRATIINGAEEISGNGAYENDLRFPNNDQGYGMSRLDRALHFNGDERSLEIFDSLHENLSLDTGESWSTEFEVNDTSEELEITLAWTDYPGSAGSNSSDPAIVNDLDLKIIAPDGTRLVGNAFTGNDPGYSEPDPVDNPWSGMRDGQHDGLNVDENVLLLPDQNGVQKGTYEVRVEAHQVPEGEQPFAVVVNGGLKTEDVTESPAVEIDRPLGTAEWYARDEEEIGWNTTAGDGNITSIDLEYSVDGGTSWDTIQEAVEDDGSYVWTVPDEPTEEARVKATVHDDNNLTGEGESELFYIKRDSHELVVDSTDGGDVVEPGEGTFEYNSSEVVDLEAVADDGYQFIEWTGNNATIDEPISNQTAISMEDNYTITAEFASTEVSEVLIYQDTDRVVEAGEELTFDAEAYDQNGNLITDDPTDFTWENATDGVFYETETGDYDVTATYEGVTSNITTVAVEPADAQSIELTPQTTNITAGDSQAFNATAYDEWGNAFDVTDDTSLSDDVDPVDRSYWTDNVITVEEAGDWNIVGEYQNTDGSVSTDEASLTVEPGTFDEVVIYLETDQTVQAGEELLFDAEAYDSYGNLITDNADDFTWENASKGVFYETKTGEYGVTAEYNGVSSRKTTVKVESAEENYVVLTPGINQTITAGETIDFDAEAYDRYDNLVDEDDINFTWQNTDSKGVFTKTTAGDYDVNATYDGVSSAITVVTVEAGRVDQVKITPRADQTITAGETMEFEAEAYDQDNNLITKNRTDFRWENATRGVFNRRRAGEYEVRASYDDVNSTLTTVTVEPSAVQRIEITPEENEVNAGETVSYEVIAFDEYENEIDDVSGNTNWSVDSGAGGSWTGSDYTAENAGEWTVTGDYDGINDTALLTVESGTVNTVELTPSSDQTITSGEQIEFSVLVYDAYGNSLGIDVDDIQWENVTRGVFYHDEAGEYDVSAAYRGIESDVVVVTVEASHELRISPEETSVQESDTVVYEAAVYDIHGKKLEDVTEHAEWSIEPGAGGSWDDNVYTSEKTGNWTVAASHEDLTAEAELKVEVENHGLEWDVNGEGAVETEGQGETYSHGETVELRAVPEEGWYFVGWSGDIKSEEGVIKVTVDRKLNVTANFAKNGTSRFDLEIITIDLEEGVAKIEFVIENIGDFEDRKEVLLTVDGEKEKKIELELEAGAREEEEMIWEPDEEGEHRVRLDCGDDFQVETVHIDDSLSEDSSDDSLDHIYLLLPGIFVIVLILAYVKRSRR